MKSAPVSQKHETPSAVHWRQAKINLDAITHNVRQLKQQARVEEFIAVVKADGYGHGAVEVASAAIRGGATRIGVADLAEAVHLVNSGISQVPVVSWLHPPEADFASAITAGVEIGISSIQQMNEVAVASKGSKAAHVHIKVETGLGRGGAAPETWNRLMREAAQLERAGTLQVVGLFSHLSGTSRDEDLKQLELFTEAITTAEEAGLKPTLLHLAATAATIRLPETHLNAVRVGLGIYGLSPFDEVTSEELGLVPAMTLQAPVVAVRDVGAGHGVSYGYDYRTAAPTRLALVPLGYADGIPRQASGKCFVTIEGRRYPVVGRIAMDQFVIDVGKDHVEVGDTVTVFGSSLHEPTADEWAMAAGTVNYTIVTGIGSRVNRTYTTTS